MLKKKMALLLAGLLLISGLMAGCSVRETNGTKIKDLEYEIVEEKELPEELAKMIEEKKAADFKLTYEQEEDRYVVRGYGEQDTGGYSIQVKECYLTSNAILFDTELIGPRKGETTTPNPSYPYIALKIANSEENVVFE